MKIKNNKKTRKYLTLVAALIALIAVASIASAITLFSSVNKTNMYFLKIDKSPKINLDVNHDGVIDQNDLDLVIECFGQTGSPGWIAEDVNKDGKVDILDVSLLNSAIYNLGESTPYYNRGTTYVNVTPSSQIIVGGDETFDITVHLDPGEPVIGVQIDLTFDPLLVQCDDVTSAGVWTYFFPPTIDNTNGLIHGAAVFELGGNVSTSTDCFDIEFTSLTTDDGTSDLNLVDVIVTDENAQQIIGVDINNGSVMVDVTAPSTSDDYVDMWHTSDITITLTASDATSGVDETYYEINGGATKSVSVDGQPLIDTEGATNSLEYWSVDLAGNEESPHVTVSNIRLDKTAPSTSDDYDGLWHTSDITITLTATDATSGVAETYYIINGGATESVSVDGQPLIDTEGATNSLEYWSVDLAGNEESPHVTVSNIRLDKTDPTISSIVVTNSTPIDTDIGWVNISCTITDSLSGVDDSNVYIYLDSSPLLWQKTGTNYYYNGTLGSGRYNYHIEATDNAGNTETTSDVPLNIAPNWDINMDGVCNINDVTGLGGIATKWLQVGTPGWIRADIDNNGVVNILDVSIISVYWLGSW